MNNVVKVGHIGWVVQDIDKSIEPFKKILGLQNWIVYDMAPPKLHDSTCYGEKVEFWVTLNYEGFSRKILLNCYERVCAITDASLKIESNC